MIMMSILDNIPFQFVVDGARSSGDEQQFRWPRSLVDSSKFQCHPEVGGDFSGGRGPLCRYLISKRA